MSKKTWIIIIVLIVGFFGFFLLTGNSKDDNNGANNSGSGTPKKIVADDHVTGSKDNKIVLMEYFDFECPACQGLYPTLEAVRTKYGDKVTFVQRYFPLTSIHQNALASARAGEAAGKQGKFFEMEKLLFDNQDTWKTPVTSGDAQKIFEGYAKELGLNIDQYKKDYASGETLTRINRDRSSGSKLGITGTPTIFLNGEKITIKEKTDIANAIDKAISENKTDPNQK